MSYIYALVDPRSHEIRYVGGTVHTLKVRLSNHISTAKSNVLQHHTSNWIRSLLKQDLKPEIIALEQVEGPYYDREIGWITGLRALGVDLTNSTDGGEGTIGCIPSQSSIALRVSKLTGLKRTSEQCLNISNGKKGKPRKPHSAEHRAKISAAQIGREKSIETRNKLSVAMTGKVFSEERRAAMRGQVRSAESREKMSLKARNRSEESRKNMSLAQIGKKLSPESIAKREATKKAKRERNSLCENS